MNRIFSKIKGLYLFKKYLRNYSFLLKKDEYIVDATLKHLIKKGSLNSAKFFGASKYNSRPMYLGREDGDYTEMLICSGGDCVKLFDYSSFVVLSLFNKEPRNSNICDLFPTAKLIEFSSREKKEELLIDRNENKFENLLDFYCEFYKKVSLIKRQTCFGTDMPFCIQHGDCWSANVFNTETGIKFIDFDLIGERFFLYDVMLYIFTEAFINKNSSILRSYLEGAYDIRIRNIVKTVDSDLVSFSNRELFLIAVEEMLNERFIKKNNRIMPKKIKDFLINEGIGE